MIDNLFHIGFLPELSEWIFIAGIMHKDTIQSVEEIVILSRYWKIDSIDARVINPIVNTIDAIRFRWYICLESGLLACVIGANNIIGTAAMQSPSKDMVIWSCKIYCRNRKKIYAPIVHIWHLQWVFAWYPPHTLLNPTKIIRYITVSFSWLHSMPISKINEKLIQSAISKSKPYSYTSRSFAEIIFCEIKKTVILADKPICTLPRYGLPVK